MCIHSMESMKCISPWALSSKGCVFVEEPGVYLEDSLVYVYSRAVAGGPAMAGPVLSQTKFKY